MNTTESVTTVKDRAKKAFGWLHGATRRANREKRSDRRTLHMTRAVTVNRSREEVYQFWRALDNLPRFMNHLESVRAMDGVSRWRAKGAAGPIEWDVKITDDAPNERIAWRSVEGSPIDNQGSVRFKDAPGDRGTEVLVELSYHTPLGAVGDAFAKLFGKSPSQQIDRDLHHFKEVMETGEILHSDASIHEGMHPARPDSGDSHEKGRER